MWIQGLALDKFRNHSSLVLDLSSAATVILGPNGSGKSSIAEALWLASKGESFKASTISEVITFESEVARVKVVFSDQKTVKAGEAEELEVLVTGGSVQGKKTQSRLYVKNGVRKRKADVVGLVPVVTFLPEDMRLVEGSPQRRRKYFDDVLALAHPEYQAALTTYETTLKKRNKLLSLIQEGKQPVSTLHYWNQQLVSSGSILQSYRTSFCSEFLSVQGLLDFRLLYVPSVISTERMDEYSNKEILVGHTLIGPHKDDFQVLLQVGNEWRDTKLFASRGQQRLAVLWLKLLELEYVSVQKGAKPLLVLDDILSELDEASRTLVLIKAKDYQTVITTTEVSLTKQIEVVLGTIELKKLALD